MGYAALTARIVAAEFDHAHALFTRCCLSIVLLLAMNSLAPLAATEPPARVVINFPFRSPEPAPTSTFLDWLAELGAPAIRQLTYHNTLWSHVEPTDDAFDFSIPDQVLFNSHGIQNAAHPLQLLRRPE